MAMWRHSSSGYDTAPTDADTEASDDGHDAEADTDADDDTDATRHRAWSTSAG